MKIIRAHASYPNKIKGIACMSIFTLTIACLPFVGNNETYLFCAFSSVGPEANRQIHSFISAVPFLFVYFTLFFGVGASIKNNNNNMESAISWPWANSKGLRNE